MTPDDPWYPYYHCRQWLRPIEDDSTSAGTHHASMGLVLHQGTHKVVFPVQEWFEGPGQVLSWLMCDGASGFGGAQFR